MKIKIIMFVFTCTIATVYCSPKEEIIQPKELENLIELHPLVENAEMDEIWFDWTLKTFFYKSIGREKYLPYTFDLYLTLTNGHTVVFLSVPNDLMFYKEGAIQSVNNVYFSSDYSKNENRINDAIYLKDLCKATATNYYDLYTILDNYNDFCKLLNSISWRLDNDSEKLCAKYSGEYCVYLYRGSWATEQENRFIEIPSE